jgi:hypothetical protein
MKTRSRTKSQTRSQNNKAGKVIAAGGYGCVFNPALKCKGEATRGKGISKMMTTYNAFEEYDEILNVKSKLKNIPDFDKYFLIDDITLCEPDALTHEDKRNFQNKCSDLLSDYTEIRDDNINQKLNEVKILNEPDGGSDIDHWTYEHELTKKNFNKLNNALIKLIKHGIIPMNKKKVYHFDIKGSNILMDKDNVARLIDWGLIGFSTTKDVIPEAIRDRPLQYNCPPSTLLLSNYFNHWYPQQLKKDKSIFKNSPVLYERIRQIASDYYNEHKHSHGEGHENYIFNQLKSLYGNTVTGQKRDSGTIFCDYYKALIVSQLTNVLMKYTDFTKNEFNDKKYFTEVYRYNVDIWGLLTCYTSLINMPSNIIHIKKKDFFRKLRDVVIRYLYSADACSTKYNYSQLFNDLIEVSKTISKKNITLSPVKQTKKQKKEKAKKVTKRNHVPLRRASFSWSKKRCPKGTRRNKRTKRCEVV